MSDSYYSYSEDEEVQKKPATPAKLPAKEVSKNEESSSYSYSDEEPKKQEAPKKVVKETPQNKTVSKKEESSEYDVDYDEYADYYKDEEDK